MSEEISAFQATEIEIELIPAKSAGKGGCYDSRDSKIPLKSQKSGKDKPGFPFQKCPDEEHPVAVSCQVILQKLLHVVSWKKNIIIVLLCQAGIMRGAGLVCLDPDNNVLQNNYEKIVSEFEDFDFDYLTRNKDKKLNAVDNSWEAIKGVLDARLL